MKLFYLLLLVVCPTIVFSQTNYLDGYVVKNNGDTIRGYINYREWTLSPKQIYFKNNKSDRSEIRYDAGAIRAFSVTDLDNYTAYRGPVSTNPTRLTEIPVGIDSTARQDTIFIKQIASGKYLSLFYYQDELKNRFFIAETGHQPYELIYIPYYSSNNTINAVYTYRNQLAYYASTLAPENEQLIRQLADTDYNESDLQLILKQINGKSNTNRARKSKKGIRFIAGINLNRTTTHFEDYKFEIGEYMNYSGFQYYAINPQDIIRTSAKITPALALGVDVFGNANIQKIVFRTEFSFSYADTKFHFPAYDRQTAHDNVEATVALKQVFTTITPQFIYNIYNTNKLKVYLDAGIGLRFISYPEKKVTLGSNILTDRYDLDSFNAVFPFQAGIVLNRKVEFSASYISNTKASHANTYQVTNQSTSIGVKYLF